MLSGQVDEGRPKLKSLHKRKEQNSTAVANNLLQIIIFKLVIRKR